MRTYRWIPASGPGLEHVAVRQEADGLSMQGVVIGGEPPGYGVSYSIACDADWRVRHAVIEVAGGGRVQLFADGAGRWHDQDGATLPQLDGCVDIDLSASCFTNTLPIRRLGAALDTRQPIEVAYVAIPELVVRKTIQAYTRLGEGRYRFESVGTGFQAELAVDADGFVIDYPGLFRRQD